jgi:hypothetical protein
MMPFIQVGGTVFYRRSLGGEGSGNFNHAGRPGEVGGSGEGGGSKKNNDYGDPITTSYRGGSSKSPLSHGGYAMFADDPTEIESYGDVLYSVDTKNLTPITDLKDEFIKTWNSKEDWERVPSYENDTGEEMFAGYDPQRIVLTADHWDDEELVGWFYTNIAEPKGLDGVKTNDGAIVFNDEIIKNRGVGVTEFLEEHI